MTVFKDLAAPSPPRPLRFGIPAGIYLLSFACFSPDLSETFLNWDVYLVVTNHEAWGGLGWGEISWMFTTFHPGHYHPLTWLRFGPDHAPWGMNPAGNHLTNLLFHAANAVFSIS